MRAGTGNAKAPIVLALHRAPLPAARGNPASAAVTKATNQLAQEGYFISQKGKGNSDDDFFMGVGSRKGTGVMKITLPHYGTAAGLGYVVMEVDNRGFLSLCKAKIRVDSARLLEDNSPVAYTSTVKELLQLEQEYPGQDPPALDLLKGKYSNNFLKFEYLCITVMLFLKKLFSAVLMHCWKWFTQRVTLCDTKVIMCLF